MAGIVASTLRRKAFHKKAVVDNRYQVVETHISQSPESHGSPSSPSFKARAGHARAPKGAKLCHEDFWPTCVNPEEQTLSNIQFETFDTLVPKANSWLQSKHDVYLIKCETLEKKITAIDELAADSSMFIPKNHHAIYVKGLRVWFVHLSGARKTFQETLPPIEIGYMNVIPKCLDSSGKYPLYENLPATYAAINAYLADVPLEGKIVTIETVPLKLPRKQWNGGLDINPDQTVFCDDYIRHILYITRIYFRYGTPEAELIGAQDFLPDYQGASNWINFYSGYPRYRPLSSAMKKLKDWITSAKHIAITNIQTLEAVYRRHPGNVHTGVNFVEKAECNAMIRFIRVTYVRPCDDFTSTHPIFSTPNGFSYKTVLPAPVKVGMCSGSPIYEDLTSTSERSKMWLRCVERRILSVETFYHPLKDLWDNQDGGETTVMKGEWTSDDRSDKQHKSRRKLVHIVRIYLDGDYIEPPPHLLPVVPMVEEINDCTCSIM